MSTPLDPKRMVAELKELRSLTSDDNGAQRVAFTRTWVETRAWLKSKLEALPVEVHTDAAGNTTANHRSRSGSWTGPTRKERVSGRAFSDHPPAPATSIWTKRAN